MSTYRTDTCLFTLILQEAMSSGTMRPGTVLQKFCHLQFCSPIPINIPTGQIRDRNNVVFVTYDERRSFTFLLQFQGSILMLSIFLAALHVVVGGGARDVVEDGRRPGHDDSQQALVRGGGVHMEFRRLESSQ